MKELDIKATWDRTSWRPPERRQQAESHHRPLAGCKIEDIDEPTRGIDIGAKVRVYRLRTNWQAKAWRSSWFSSEILEVLGMSASILVMWRGKTAQYFPRAKATEEKVLEAALLGGNNHHE